MDFNPVILSIPIYFALIAIEWTYDLITKKGIYRIADAYANITNGIFEQITGVFIKISTIGLYVLIFDNFHKLDIPTTWPYLILMWIAIDFSYYWAHRWSHTINLFWIGHIVHHQSEDYNFSVALRQGALQKVFTSWVYLPMAFLGFDPTWFVIIGALNTVYQFWIHTEQINKMKWFGIIFNTPSHHRVHHGRNPKYIDKNHAGSLIIWDKMFGTFQAEEETPVYGITKPTEHWDPVSSHLQPIIDMVKDIMSVKGVKNKVAILYQAPGWLPKENGGPRKVPEVSKINYHKFKVTIPKSLQIYLFIHFLIILGASALFLFKYGSQSLQTNLFEAFGLSFSMISLGLLFEARRYAWILETIRLLTIFLLTSIFIEDWSKFIVDVFIISSIVLVYKNKDSLKR